MDRIQTTVFAQSLSNFTCRLWMKRGETLLNLSCGVIGQGQVCLPARGCHALSCLVLSEMVRKSEGFVKNTEILSPALGELYIEG